MPGILEINYSIIIGINILIVIVIGFSLSSSNRFYKARIFFIGLIVAITAWLISLLLLNTSTQKSVIDFVGRSSFAAAPFIMLFLYFFSVHFPEYRQTKQSQSAFISSP
jgi:hypothetical protein